MTMPTTQQLQLQDLDNRAIAGKRALEAPEVKQYLNTWQQIANQDNIEHVVISLGSGGVPKQQQPKFLSNLSNTCVLNIDPVARGAASDFAKNSYYLPASLKFSASGVIYGPRFAERKREAVEIGNQFRDIVKQLQQAGKKIILINNTSVFITDNCKELLQDNLDNYGTNFVAISSYFAFSPAYILTKKFIQDNIIAEENNNDNSVNRNRFDELTRLIFNDSKGIQQHILEQRTQDFTDWGTFFSDLDDIAAEQLFTSVSHQAEQSTEAGQPLLSQFHLNRQEQVNRQEQADAELARAMQMQEDEELARAIQNSLYMI
jgi:hypothetical protein